MRTKPTPPETTWQEAPKGWCWWLVTPDGKIVAEVEAAIGGAAPFTTLSGDKYVSRETAQRAAKAEWETTYTCSGPLVLGPKKR